MLPTEACDAATTWSDGPPEEARRPHRRGNAPVPGTPSPAWRRAAGRAREDETLSDPAATVLSFVCVLAIVGLAEGLRRAGRIPFDTSRKIVHIGVGTWILPTVLLFDSPWWAAAPPAVFVLLNLLSHRAKWVRAMDEESGDNLGTILFPLAFVVLIALFWGAEHGRRCIAGGILVLAWGDAAAALIGKRFGRHRYRAGSGWRSLEGSAAMFGFSLLALAATGALVPPPFSAPVLAAGATVATAVEAGSRRGFDNLLVPLGTSAILWGLG